MQPCKTLCWSPSSRHHGRDGPLGCVRHLSASAALLGPHHGGSPTANARSPHPSPPGQGGWPSLATYSPPLDPRRARDIGVWKWKLTPLPGERQHLGPAGLGQVHPGRWGPRDYPSLPGWAWGLPTAGQSLYPKPRSAHGASRAGLKLPSWLGPGSLQGPHVPGLGPGAGVPGRRRSSWVGPGACPWERSLLCWGLNHRANRLQASQDWLHQAPDSGGLEQHPTCQWEPITSLSWRRVGAREAREQFLGLRESLAQESTSQASDKPRGLEAGLPSPSAKSLGGALLPALGAPSEVPQGPPKDRAQGRSWACSCAGGREQSLGTVASLPGTQLPLALTGQSHRQRDHHEHRASLSSVSTLGFSWALGPGPHPPHRPALGTLAGSFLQASPPHALLVA